MGFMRRLTARNNQFRDKKEPVKEKKEKEEEERPIQKPQAELPLQMQMELAVFNKFHQAFKNKKKMQKQEEMQIYNHRINKK